MFNTKPHHRLGLPPYHRRLLCEALEARTLLSVALTQASSAAQQQTLADLPIAAQHSISSAIGQDQSAYHAASIAAGVTLANPANGFTAQVQSGTLHVSAGSDTWDMSLVGLGYGGAVQPVGTAQTATNGNRVDCNYATVDEWYVNGPSGLEQGFTALLPQSDASGSLTVELALGGDLVATVNAARDGLTLTGPDGPTALGYTGLTACDAAGNTLPASLEVRADSGHQELLIHVNDAGAQGSITIDPFVQVAKLTASDGARGDLFGCAVAINESGNTLVVGVDGASSSCAAYVFTGSGSGWTQTAKLTESDRPNFDGFDSCSVAISGNTVVVGATQAYSNRAGAAYVFTEPTSGWTDMTQTAKLISSDGAVYDEFGSSVSITGSTVVVGACRAPWNLGANTAGPGAAYVFTEPASGWVNMTQTAKLTASDGAANDGFGQSVSISGDTVVVGALYANCTIRSDGSVQVGPGAAYVFTKPASGWTSMTQTAKLRASGGEAGDWFGYAVAINESGNTVVVGAPLAPSYNSSTERAGPGAAYVFTKSGSRWTQTAELTASDGAAHDWFGYSVSISGNTVVVGALSATVNGNNFQGAAYVFTGSGSAWIQAAKLTASDGATPSSFGSSVSISGNTIVVGAYSATVGGNIQQGATYVFAAPPPLLPLIVNAADFTSAGLTLTLGSDGNLHVYTTRTTTDAVPPCAPAGVSNIDITGRRYINLTIDSTNGDPIPAGGLNYSGGGGLIISGSGTVILSATNTYTGGTTVSSGTLQINTASALPSGRSLTVGARGTFIFDPSSTGASSVTSAMPVTSDVDSSVRASSATAVANVVKHGTLGHNWQSPIAPPAVLQPPQSVFAVVLGIPAKRTAADPDWLGQAANSSDTSDQQRKKEVAILALEAVFAQHDR